jgi:hypothetical protein
MRGGMPAEECEEPPANRTGRVRGRLVADADGAGAIRSRSLHAAAE